MNRALAGTAQYRAPTSSAVLLTIAALSFGLARCAQAPSAELALVAERIETSADSSHAEEFAPVTIGRARKMLSSAIQKADTRDFAGAIEDAAEAARLADAAGELAQKERARTARQTAQTIQDCRFHLELLVHRFEGIRTNEVFATIDHELTELETTAQVPSVRARDSAWNLKLRLIELESSLSSHLQ